MEKRAKGKGGRGEVGGEAWQASEKQGDVGMARWGSDERMQNSGESANTRRRKMQYKLFIQANPGKRCKIQVGHSGERQYNRAKVGKWMPGKG